MSRTQPPPATSATPPPGWATGREAQACSSEHCRHQPRPPAATAPPAWVMGSPGARLRNHTRNPRGGVWLMPRVYHVWPRPSAFVACLIWTDGPPLEPHSLAAPSSRIFCRSFSWDVSYTRRVGIQSQEKIINYTVPRYGSFRFYIYSLSFLFF